jgi:glycosyltransferase involved in cell wall biosynthesis
VVRNARSSIAATLESIAGQKVPGIEYLVIDGNSNDGTAEVIAAWRHVIDVLVCEPDRGIYDAMNKAAARARGRFILHINAGDTLLRAPLSELSAASDDVAVLAFPVVLSKGGIFSPRTGLWLSITNTIHHQGACYRRDRLPPYDLRYRTFADFDLNQRLRHGALALPHAAPVARHTEDGQSQMRGHFHEVYTIVRRNGGVGMAGASWLFFKLRGLHWRVTSLCRSFC